MFPGDEQCSSGIAPVADSDRSSTPLEDSQEDFDSGSDSNPSSTHTAVDTSVHPPITISTCTSYPKSCVYEVQY